MNATHRVKSNYNTTLGFIVGGNYMEYSEVKRVVSQIGNLILQKNGVVRAKRSLPCVSYREGVIKRKRKELIQSNPIPREVQGRLYYWRKLKHDKILQVFGPWQSGKTTEVLRFAYKYYEYIIHVNIENDRHNFGEVIEHTDLKQGMRDYCYRANLPKYIDSRGTILIIDEVQNNLKVYNSLEALHNKLNCDIAIITSDSFKLRNSNENRTDIIHCVNMQTLTFKEFAWAFGIQWLLDNIDINGKGKQSDYDKLKSIYNIYIDIGGYPKAVTEYLRTKKYKDSTKITRSILERYEAELCSMDIKGLTHGKVYKEILQCMCHSNKGSFYKNIKQHKELLLTDYEIASIVESLRCKGIVDFCALAVEGDMNNISNDEKLYFCDCGVLSYLLKRFGLCNGYSRGISSETFVFNELRYLYRDGIDKHKVSNKSVCFSMYNSYELDFVVCSDEGKIYGIEVKTGKGKAVSLREFIRRKIVDVGVVVKPSHGGHNDMYDTVPIYAVGCRFPYGK